jgi:hypothetical protein
MSGRHGAKAAAVVVVGVFAIGTLGACDSVRTGLGSTSSNCYLVLPDAVQAVHDHGHLDGMRLINSNSLVTSAPDLAGAVRSGPSGSQVCLVAFGGHFASSDVERPVGGTVGGVAVVETTYPGGRVVATWLGSRSPVKVGHTHVGVP